MAEEQKKFVDKNRKDDDSDGSSENSGDEGDVNEHTFISAIDVGSHFVDVNPHNELSF